MDASTHEAADGAEDEAPDSAVPGPRPTEQQPAAAPRPQQRTDVRRRILALRRW